MAGAGREAEAGGSCQWRAYVALGFLLRFLPTG